MYIYLPCVVPLVIPTYSANYDCRKTRYTISWYELFLKLYGRYYKLMFYSAYLTEIYRITCSCSFNCSPTGRYWWSKYRWKWRPGVTHSKNLYIQGVPTFQTAAKLHFYYELISKIIPEDGLNDLDTLSDWIKHIRGILMKRWR